MPTIDFIERFLSRSVEAARTSPHDRSRPLTDNAPSAPGRLPHDAREYLAHRLDGARDLYLLALALGTRGDGATLFGRMIREARIHFAAVIEECRIAGLDTSAIAVMLGKANRELVDSIRPEIWEHLETLMAQRARGHAG